jgi:MFS family permease
MATEDKKLSTLSRIPRGVWTLGLVSLFMDVSSEMVHALLPIYLVTVLGASVLTVGFIEGLAEATANITKIFSGALSDWLGKRKLLAAVGYGLAAFTKPWAGWSLRVSSTASEKGSGVRRVTRSSPISHRPPCVARVSGYVNRSIR